MKKLFKSFAVMVLTVAVALTVFSVTAFAANPVIIAFSPNKTLTPGETLVVTVTINPNEEMYGVGCIINYDAAVFSYESGNATGGSGSLKIIESPSGDKKVSYQLTFKAIAAGSAVFAVSDCNYETITESKSLTGASASISVTDVTLSGNANLSALSVSAGTLSPKFSASKTSYNVTVANSVTQFTVYATAADPSATVNVPATTNLKIGKNTVAVTVTAPNGTQKTYTITVTRSEAPNSDPIESTPETSDPEPVDEDIIINGIKYTPATDISGMTLPSGFTIGTATYKGEELPVAASSDKKYELYYLAADGSTAFAPFIYDPEEDVFEPVVTLQRNGKIYIVEDIPDYDDVPDDFYITNTTIDSFDIKCLRQTESGLADFCYIYCYLDGKSGFYRYDSAEGSLQRYPEISLGLTVDKPLDEDDGNGLADRFGALNGNQKTVVIAFVIVVVAIIGLIIMLIKKVASKKNDDNDSLVDDVDNDDDFDEVEVTDAAENKGDDF